MYFYTVQLVTWLFLFFFDGTLPISYLTFFSRHQQCIRETGSQSLPRIQQMLARDSKNNNRRIARLSACYLKMFQILKIKLAGGIWRLNDNECVDKMLETVRKPLKSTLILRIW